MVTKYHKQIDLYEAYNLQSVHVVWRLKYVRYMYMYIRISAKSNVNTNIYIELSICH